MSSAALTHDWESFVTSVLAMIEKVEDRLRSRLVDVGGLSREEAVKTMRWSANTILKGALS